ncbi:hypothetical protein IAD21_01299 [Abditibacteriota bacterium]|nr:hypothetical protein IAD21_01299 [Abditibacteriota bacterium]
MATKIDLLPGYVKWTKRFHYTIAGAIVGLCLWTGGLILVYHSKQLELQTALENQAAAQTVADQATTAANNAVQANTEAGGYTAANDFFLLSCKTGSKRSALLNLINDYIDFNSVVKSIDISDGSKVVIVATVTTPEEYSRFLLHLRNATGVVFQSNPRFTTTAVGGFGNGAQPLVIPQPAPGSPAVVVNYPITLQAEGTLIYPLDVPTDPTGGATAAPGTGGAPTAP